MKKVRQAVRLFVFNGDWAYIGKRKKMTYTSRVTLPGGGIEDHQTPEEACKAEALEESGLDVTDIESIPYSYTYPITFKDKERAKAFSHMEDHFYIGRYVSSHMGKWDSEGDGLEPLWVPIKDFKSVWKKWNGEDFYSVIVFEAFDKALELRKYKLRTNPLW